MWGLSPSDNNTQIDNYKLANGVGNLCAGTDGGGPEAIDLIIEGQNFQRYPTFCIICPDKTLYFDICYPPTEECFDPYIENCNPASIDELSSDDVIGVYPNPSNGLFTISINHIDDASISIINTLGVTIKSLEVDARNHYVTSLDLSEYAEGIYLISVQTENKLFVKKLKLQK